MRILACDDEEVVLKVVQLALKDKAEVITARDGWQAMQFLKNSEPFDLIITDLHMPHHNGDELFNLVRKEQGHKTPFVMLSSDGEEEVIKLALKQGIDDYIVKPIDATKLLAKISKYLK
jgi:DNA-binding response OmpR family regulator